MPRSDAHKEGDSKRHSFNRISQSTILKLVEPIGASISITYLVLVYILPLTRIIETPTVPFKLLVEGIICIVPVVTSTITTYRRIRDDTLSLETINDVFVLSLGTDIVATSCLELVSVPGSIESNNENQPQYNTSMLLALRAGMKDRVSLAYETGVSDNEPFLRLFLTAVGHTLTDVREVLLREATRAEAILLASLNNIELRQLHDKELKQAIDSVFKTPASHTSKKEDQITRVFSLRGTPRVNPSHFSSQIGTFLSTIIRQGHSASVTCVLSRSKPGREKKRLENKWKTIREKEKNREDSLKDQALKKKLLTDYQRIESEEGWFTSSTYLTIRADTSKSIEASVEAVTGIVQSIWGGSDSGLDIRPEKLTQRNKYRLMTRRHLRSDTQHVSSAVAFINTPVQQLPVISASYIPEFAIPPKSEIKNELIIGSAVFKGRPISEIGLRIEWLREHVAVLGATGSGKTTLVKHIISELSTKTEVPWWVFDVKGGEYSNLIDESTDNKLLIKPGVDDGFVISLMNPELLSDDRHAHTTFAILREIIREQGTSSELSPAMEKLLREAVVDLARDQTMDKSVQALIHKIKELCGTDRISMMTHDALLNRLEILSREPLGSILKGSDTAVRISDLLEKRVVFDLSHVARAGGMDAARLLYNLVAKQIFDYAMKRGVKTGLHHVVVLEEANNLVPESYTRNTSADVTTGESMVMLQRATGQGVIVISTRPNISSNILANTGTKVTFRLPFDSLLGGRFMTLDEPQERYLRTLKRGRALISMPGTQTFEMETKPFHSDEMIVPVVEIETQLREAKHSAIVAPEATDTSKGSEVATETSGANESVVFDRMGEIANHIIAFLASRNMATEIEIQGLLRSLDPHMEEEDMTEIIRDLVSLGTIDREALSLVPGGFLYTLPGKGLEVVSGIITDYINQRLGPYHEPSDTENLPQGIELIIEDKAIMILPEHLRTKSLESTLDRIRHQMAELGNNVTELIVIVRGSVVAAKIRELMDSHPEFNEVTIVSAFPKSLDTIVELLTRSRPELKQDSATQILHDEDAKVEELIGAVHEVGTSTSRAIQMRIWFSLIQDFVEISNGQIDWSTLLEFIETTAVQSLRGRSAPMNIDEGRRALTELLADEVLIAVRLSDETQLGELKPGLWVVNSTVFTQYQNTAVDALETELQKKYGSISRGHEFYDICADDTSYVIFPTQQQLNTLLHLNTQLACRTCKTQRIVCVLPAAEYFDDSTGTPENMILRTMDSGIASIIV
jgi:Cdc6-like AAA superfamily ATPase